MSPRTAVRSVLVACAFLVAGPFLRAQQATLPDAVRTAADRINAAQLGRDLEFLASDALKGRNTPSPGFDEAAAFIAKRLERAGLKPAGDDGGFFQRYEMRESRVDTAAARLEIDGRAFAFGSDFVLRAFAAPVDGTYPVVYVGHGWTVPDRGVDPFGGLDVKGKVVLAHGPRALPKDVEIRQIGRVTPGASSVAVEAARRGAAAVVYIPQAQALEGWEQMRTQNLVRREMEPSVPSAYAAQPLTSVMLSRAAVDALFAGEKVNGEEVVRREEARDYPSSFQLQRTLALRVPAASTLAHRPYNVVAILEGTDPELRSEYITVESHLDGAVGTREVNGDAIYNSADDNASGSAATLAIAEEMARARPKRSIVFIWDSGEEQGLWGTRWFVHQPPVPLERIVAHFNIDMIGANRAAGSPDADETRVTGANEVFLIGPAALSASVDALLERVNRSYLNMQFNRQHDRPDSEFFYPRTDAGPFLERGILTIGFTTGIHNRYHLPTDEARTLDPKKMETIARTVFASIWMLADSPDRPRIDKGVPATVPRYGSATR